MAQDHPIKTDRDLANSLKAVVGQKPGESDEAAKNRANASEQLGSIFALKDSEAFGWFFKECLRKQYRAAKDALESSEADPNELAKLHTRFTIAREQYEWIPRREILHRRTLDPSDPEILRLEAELRLQ